MALSPSAVAKIDALRAELLQRQGEHGTVYGFEFTEAQVEDMAAGYVPRDVVAAMRAALDWAEEDRRRAGRPIRKTKERAT